MQMLKDVINEKKDEIIKLLFIIIVGLIFIVLFFIYKKSGRVEELSENEMIEEILQEKEFDEEIVELTNLSTEQVVDAEINQEIVVDVKGAVEIPGVYTMGINSRVIDCIEKAGGFLTDAEQKSVNLAQRVEDQMVVYIPMKGEDLSEYETLLLEKPASQSASEDKKIDLNHATKEELKTLSGIGNTKAESIIDYREINGSFQKIEEITNVSGIGEATFEKLKEAIQVNP